MLVEGLKGWPAVRTQNDGSDPVTDEIERWKPLSPDSFSEFVDDGSLLNEFAMMWELRERFPLHFIVFKQTACHLSHEVNIEQVFSEREITRPPIEYGPRVPCSPVDGRDKQEVILAVN